MPLGALWPKDFSPHCWVISCRHINPFLITLSPRTSLAVLPFWLVVPYCCLWDLCFYVTLSKHHPYKTHFSVLCHLVVMSFFFLNPETPWTHYLEASDFTVKTRLGRHEEAKRMWMKLTEGFWILYDPRGFPGPSNFILTTNNMGWALLLP